ncbi:MAG: tRNA lysidine(34) synthetase TilS [Flavobacteriia bacterium]|nr:tRNA lysidine(34) synthetase TilS [Flavobacteriia bacterium]
MNKALQILKKKSLLNKTIYLACSGGVDSMVLLDLLLKSGLNCTVLHVNYQLRAIESELDEKFVVDYCKNKNIPVNVLKITNEQKNDLLKSNLQEKARKIRYNWFNTFLKDRNSLLLLAHHLDDQIETFYMNLARKSGVKGLSCMKFKSKKVFRPLLHCSKNSILKYANACNLEWREDSSNSTLKYNRNKLRNEILPNLFKNNSTLKKSILEFISVCQNTDAENTKIINKLVYKVKIDELLTSEEWNELNDDQKVKFIEHFNFLASQLGEWEKLLNCQKGKKISSKKFIVYREKNGFSFVNLKKKTPLPRLIIDKVYELPTTFNKEEIFLDPTKIIGKLHHRIWNEGDKISILGTNGKKLVSDIIKDNLVASYLKNQIIVVHDDSNIHLCVGLAVGKEALADKNSENILKISLKK